MAQKYSSKISVKKRKRKIEHKQIKKKKKKKKEKEKEKEKRDTTQQDNKKLFRVAIHNSYKQRRQEVRR